MNIPFEEQIARVCHEAERGQSGRPADKREFATKQNVANQAGQQTNGECLGAGTLTGANVDQYSNTNNTISGSGGYILQLAKRHNFCPECGRKREPEWNFCPLDGTNLTAQPWVMFEGQATTYPIPNIGSAGMSGETR